ncbi:EexN family lipoprotein [Burkholderia semiarida]|uniref:EexN family lipoprotein n=1 Tax=Burkholderia semiarida TaxID=2843303 RepID=A0ABW7LAX2_9BURK
MKHPIVIALVLTIVGLAACGQREPEPKTVDYFMQHPSEIEATQKDCRNKGISLLADTPEARTCNAANSAMRARFFGHSASGVQQ